LGAALIGTCLPSLGGNVQDHVENLSHQFKEEIQGQKITKGQQRPCQPTAPSGATTIPQQGSTYSGPNIRTPTSEQNSTLPHIGMRNPKTHSACPQTDPHQLSPLPAGPWTTCLRTHQEEEGRHLEYHGTLSPVIPRTSGGGGRSS